MNPNPHTEDQRMPTDPYAELVRDMVSAYGAELFIWTSGRFWRTRIHNVGTFGWPWEFTHRWAIEASHQTRDALIRHGWVEEIPQGFTVGAGDYRMSLKAMREFGRTPGSEDTPSLRAFHDAYRKAEAEKAQAGPHRTTHTEPRW